MYKYLNSSHAFSSLLTMNFLLPCAVSLLPVLPYSSTAFSRPFFTVVPSHHSSWPVMEAASIMDVL
jgi:hypothetical protein